MDNRFNNIPEHNTTHTDEIDIISFDRRKRAEQIRQNADADRERRRIQQMQKRREERLRRLKIERIKRLCLLVVMAVGALFILIGVISVIVKASLSGSNDTPAVVDNKVSAEETQLIANFSSFDGLVFTDTSNTYLATAGKMISDIAMSIENSASVPASSTKISEFGEISERYALFSTTDAYLQFREQVKNAPIFSNGYIWSETDNIKSSLTDGYMYDTNTSYIIAVTNICLAEGSTAFLSEYDTDAEPRRDVSKGKSVSEKLNMAINYLFDNNTIDGGLKFDTISSLCYIHTADNNGTSSGKPSNKWFNFRFGYLDAYTNISFNKAMQKLAVLYTLEGAPEKADQYNTIAENHAQAFNEKFWDSVKQRYVGCFDKNGNIYDYGFVFVNLEAIEAGIADTEKADAIFSWIDGNRLIESDTSKGSDIYAYTFAPRNTTVPAEDKWWDYLGGTLPLSAEGGYNKYYQNGGVSLSGAYYDIMSRYTTDKNDVAAIKLYTLVKQYESGTFAQNGNPLYCISQSAVNGLAPTAFLKTGFGLYSDGLHLNITPDYELLSPSGVLETQKTSLKSFGIKQIGYAKNTYNFLFDNQKVYITAVNQKPVRINVGGFEADTGYDIVVVNSETEISRIPFKSDSNGVISLAAEFGGTSYLKIEKLKSSDTNKSKK